MNQSKITPKGFRVSKGDTQQALADYLKLSLTQYQRKENGHVRFYADEIHKLAIYYDVPVEIFFS